MSFEKLGLRPPLIETLEKMDIITPTDIQREVIPLILSGRDVIGNSPTGTGKTLAYLLPVLERLDLAKNEVQAIILAPTHELVIQIQRIIEEIAKCGLCNVVSFPIIGNVNIVRQIEKLKKNKPHLLVGSSGRILELIQKRKIAATKVKTIILDEADRLLDDNNIDSVKMVIKSTFKDRQLLMFSATMPPVSLKRAREMMNNPELASKDSRMKVPDAISHWYFVCQERDKTETLKKLIAHLKIEKALVFINNSYAIETTLSKLNFHGLSADALFGSAYKNERQKALENFRQGKVRLLLTSDLGSRGLDIPDAPYIFSLEMPEDPGLYLHRAGRTGRAGQKGVAISLVTAKELPLLAKTQKALNITILPKATARGKIFDAKF